MNPATTNLTLTPAQIEAELDRYIVGQQKAKRAVAIALRNRWRRQNLPAELRVDVPVAFGKYLLLPAIPSFSQRYPDISLEVRFNDRYVDMRVDDN